MPSVRHPEPLFSRVSPTQGIPSLVAAGVKRSRAEMSGGVFQRIGRPERQLPPAPADAPITKAQGKKSKSRSLMQPAAWVAFHPFSETLEEWEHGVPVDCGPDWDAETVDQAILKGPHRSALDPEAIRLVHEDLKYQVDAGFSRIVLWDEVKGRRPPKLKISPLAVIPQTDRHGQLILDLSFPVHRHDQGKKQKLGPLIQDSVNSR